MAEEALVTDDLDVSDIPEGTFTADEDAPPEFDETEEVETEDKDKKKKEDPPAKDDIPADFKTRFEDLEKNYKRASDHIEDLNKALSQVRRENKELKKGKPNDDGDAVFTDAQLLAIMEENKDDPGVMLQAMKQLIKQGNADVQKLTDKKVELVSKRNEVESVMTGWKGYIEKNQDTIEKVVDYHDLGDHPFKEHLALGALLVQQWPKLVESIKDQAKQEALNGKADKARKTTIKNNKPDTGGEDATTGDGDTPKSWIEAANTLGLKGKQRDRYFNMMKKSSKKRSD